MPSLADIKKELDKQKDKISYLKDQIEKNPEIKSDLRKLLIDAVKSRGLVKTPVLKKDIQYTIIYDAFGEGLEHIYFWFLDFMRDRYQGLGMDVSKTKDDYEASVTSTFFGEHGARATRMQEQAMKMMQTINTVIRSMINIIYDLKEFEIRLEIYTKYHSKNKEDADAALLSLKQIWMDQVDIKRGRGSINNLTQQLQFVTLRDAFMVAKTVKEVDKIDLNDRVKRILKPRVQEFLAWLDLSERELRKRYNVEKSYLKSQLSSLKLYATWTKPYLKAAQQLGMKEFNQPDVVNAFNNLILELALFGKTSIGKTGAKDKEKEYFGCVEIILRYRTVPLTTRTQQGTQFIHSGRTRVDIKAYAFTNEDLELLKEQELYEGLDLIEDMVGTPLSELREDIDKYLKEEKEEEKKKKEKEMPTQLDIAMPFRALKEGFKDISQPFKPLFRIKKKAREPWQSSELRKQAESDARVKADIIYDVYKKTHGMMSWT